MMPLTKEQLHILQHSLGVDEYGRGGQYRNHYVSDPRPELEELVAFGLMVDRDASALCGEGMHSYHVTPEGKLRMRELSPVPPRLTRSQRRYREFLAADLGMKFGEYLKRYHGKPRDYREDLWSCA